MNTNTDKIPASTDLPLGSDERKGLKGIPRSPVAISIAALLIAMAIFALLALLISGIESAAGYPGNTTGDTQGFGICDSGGSADEASLATNMEELTTFTAMKVWAPELELSNQLERYTMVGRTQLDRCRIVALIDNATGEYYAFIFMLDEQGSYIVGMSRANLSEAPENLPAIMLSRPRQ